MRKGKKPTRTQRKLIEYYGFDAHDWLVITDTSTEITIVHRRSDKTVRAIPKG